MAAVAGTKKGKLAGDSVHNTTQMGTDAAYGAIGVSFAHDEQAHLVNESGGVIRIICRPASLETAAWLIQNIRHQRAHRGETARGQCKQRSQPAEAQPDETAPAGTVGR